MQKHHILFPERILKETIFSCTGFIEITSQKSLRPRSHIFTILEASKILVYVKLAGYIQTEIS